MDTIKRISPVLISSRRLNNKTMEAKYKTGYGYIIVRSKFSEDKVIGDLFYRIIRKKYSGNRKLRRTE
jgi:hypothetical protein